MYHLSFTRFLCSRIRVAKYHSSPAAQKDAWLPKEERTIYRAEQGTEEKAWGVLLTRVSWTCEKICRITELSRAGCFTSSFLRCILGTTAAWASQVQTHHTDEWARSWTSETVANNSIQDTRRTRVGHMYKRRGVFWRFSWCIVLRKVWIYGRIFYWAIVWAYTTTFGTRPALPLLQARVIPKALPPAPLCFFSCYLGFTIWLLIQPNPWGVYATARNLPSSEPCFWHAIHNCDICLKTFAVDSSASFGLVFFISLEALSCVSIEIPDAVWLIRFLRIEF